MHHLALLIKDLFKRDNLNIPKRVQLLSCIVDLTIHEVLLISQLLELVCIYVTLEKVFLVKGDLVSDLGLQGLLVAQSSL
jgi:hypothetical protein